MYACALLSPRIIVKSGRSASGQLQCRPVHAGGDVGAVRRPAPLVRLRATGSSRQCGGPGDLLAESPSSAAVISLPSVLESAHPGAGPPWRCSDRRRMSARRDLGAGSARSRRAIHCDCGPTEDALSTPMTRPSPLRHIHQHTVLLFHGPPARITGQLSDLERALKLSPEPGAREPENPSLKPRT